MYCFDEKSVDFNFRVFSLLGYKLEQLIGKSLFLFHHALDGEVLEKAFRTRMNDLSNNLLT